MSQELSVAKFFMWVKRRASIAEAHKSYLLEETGVAKHWNQRNIGILPKKFRLELPF